MRLAFPYCWQKINDCTTTQATLVGRSWVPRTVLEPRTVITCTVCFVAYNHCSWSEGTSSAAPNCLVPNFVDYFVLFPADARAVLTHFNRDFVGNAGLIYVSALHEKGLAPECGVQALDPSKQRTTTLY